MSNSEWTPERCYHLIGNFIHNSHEGKITDCKLREYLGELWEPEVQDHLLQGMLDNGWLTKRTIPGGRLCYDLVYNRQEKQAQQA